MHVIFSTKLIICPPFVYFTLMWQWQVSSFIINEMGISKHQVWLALLYKYIAEKDTLFDEHFCFYSVSIHRFFLSKSVSQSPVVDKNPPNTSQSFSLK